MTAEARFIAGDWLPKCLAALQADGYTVFAPGRDGDVTRFMSCESADAIALDVVNTKYPLKEVFFPMTETLLGYQLSKTEGESFTAPSAEAKQLAVLGCRPCDAASLGVLDKVFNWDYEDVPFNTRRKSSLIMTVGCATSDEQCFCTTLGHGPEATDGSDWLIQEIPGRGAKVILCSEKGQAFAEAHKDILTDVPDDAEPVVADVPVSLDVEKIKPWLDEHFDDELWEEIALACLGCGACSYLCPTCHCFDIVDEGNWQGGERRRNYDCCSYSLFTLHTSGHNPRPTQASRWRNRLMHKFRYFEERFGRRACVGCGRCTRLCGAGKSLVGVLQDIISKADANAPAEASS